MQTFSGTQILRTFAVCLGIGAMTVGICLPMRAQEVPLKQQVRGRHRLLRRVYVNAPDTDVKGLAASIKAEEITVKHRIRAVRYLATIDTVAYPEAKEMLLDRLHNDRWEEVRFEAAKALRLMMAGNAGGRQRTPRLFRMWLRRWRRHTRRSFRTRVRGRFDFQTNPCDPQTLNALVRTAYELDCDGYCFEPSMRVRSMAVLAIRASGVVCDVGPYIAGGQMQLQSDVDVPIEPLTTNSALASSKLKDFDSRFKTDPRVNSHQSDNAIWDSVENELASAFTEEPKLTDEAFAPMVEPIRVEVGDDSIAQTSGLSEDEAVLWDLAETSTTRASKEQATDFEPTPFVVEEPVGVPQPIDTPAACLQGKCIVALMLGQELPAKAEYQATYEDRLYHFSSAAALAKFRSDPERYSLAYAGFDPVTYASSQTVVDGTILRFYEGRYYAFASRENWNEFQSQADLYALRNEDLLSDEELRQQTMAEFEEIEAAMREVEANPAAFGVEAQDVQFEFGDEPTIEGTGARSESEPRIGSSSRVNAPKPAAAEFSFGASKDDTSQVSEFGEGNLTAPAPAFDSKSARQESTGFEEAITVPDDEPIDFGEPDEALSEIETIFGVKVAPAPKPKRPAPKSEPPAPTPRVVKEVPRFAVQKPEPIIERRRPQTQSRHLLRVAPIKRPSTRVSGWSTDRKSAKRQESGQLRASSITKNATTKPVQVRPIERVRIGSGTKSIRSTLPARTTAKPIRPTKPSERSALRTSPSRVESLIPRETSSTPSLRMKSDPSKVTTITRRR